MKAFEHKPYVPSWCYEKPGPRICKCGHHEGYHNDDGECLNRWSCKCQGAHWVAASEIEKQGE